MKFLRAIGAFFLLLLSPVLLVVSALALAATDILFSIFGRKSRQPPSPACANAASVVIPNWNGRDLLEKYLPSVIAALSGNSDNEIIVVDNASEDGSAEFITQQFPGVRVIRSIKNLGFGGGSNLGFKEAKNDIVVLLNSDMRVEPDFLAPLLQPFNDPLTFSVSCQIFFSDPLKRREETGLTQGWWGEGRLRVRHREDDNITSAFPCFYGGGGSSAYDRRKFLELNGFDQLLRPFYYEDTDLGYMAWKRGWKVLYAPQSIVYHEHRGTIGRKFSPEYIQSVLKKNAILFVWKNIHDWRMLAGHFVQCFGSSVRTLVAGDAPGTFSSAGLAKAMLQLGPAVGARWRAKALASVDDREAFRRPLAGYFRDRFQAPNKPAPERLRVLFVSPYPIEPPVHGGAVFMKLSVESLAAMADVHLCSMVDSVEQLPAQQRLNEVCASTTFHVRKPMLNIRPSSLLPHAVREFADDDFAWAIHRVIYEQQIDVVQIEYTMMAQYAGAFRHLPCMLFEHDIYFQSIARGLRQEAELWTKLHHIHEYLRALRYELRVLSRATRVQVCSRENADYLASFLPRLKPRIDADCRTGIRLDQYRFSLRPREAETMLFIGSFRHAPNVDGLRWFITVVLPRVTAMKPNAQLVVVGADRPPALASLLNHPNVRMTGFVTDIREPLSKYAVFVCPILSGSGVRVKLLEAFASGIPAVSTRIGAEGLADMNGDFCELADSPDEFARAVVNLFEDQERAGALAARARHKVETENDARIITGRLESSYRKEVEARRPVRQHRSVEQPEHENVNA
jgi:O-antigen biosynthesis protein